jgi:MarR family 2-MHQ and catechol resistance regulon transcriptional repressor
MAVTSGNVTFLVDSLEKSGLVRRVPHPTDRRIKELELTAEGSMLADALTAKMAAFMNMTCEGFNPEEMVAFGELIAKFHTNCLKILGDTQTRSGPVPLSATS